MKPGCTYMKFGALAVCLLLGRLSSVAMAAENRQIAVTFDDLPIAAASGNDLGTHRTITLRLLQTLVERKIPVIGFVNEGKLMSNGVPVPERVDLLRLWLAAGFDLGNHSFSHPDLHRVSLAEFQDDVLRGEAVTKTLLAERGRELEFFRHPFLHTGRDLETKHGLESFLTEQNYRVAPVTIDNSEWIFAQAYVNALRIGDTSLANQVGDDYVAYMLEMVRFYESQSVLLFDRNISHVLLVHANELNSVWFGRLADGLVTLGYEFVSLTEALRDPAYESADTFTGPGGITWLHRWAITRNVDRRTFRGEPTTPEYILKLTELQEYNYSTNE